MRACVCVCEGGGVHIDIDRERRGTERGVGGRDINI